MFIYHLNLIINQHISIMFKSNHLVFIFTILIILQLFPLSYNNPETEEDKGLKRLRELRQKTAASAQGILDFTYQDFKQYALSYPRPYDIVIYFTAPSCKLCEQLQPEYDYMAELYYQQGAITAEKNPTFFVKIAYSRNVMPLYQMFGFKTAPNLVVSKPYMAVVSQTERSSYIQKFKWAISYSDGHVTCHKMLDFANQRTDKSVIYKPTLSTMLQTFFGFVAVAAVGVYIYLNMKAIWTNWMVWFIGSMLIYIICVSGFIYDIIHDVPFVGRNPKTGETQVFAGGNREQYGAEGVIISVLLSGIGFLFISVFTVGEKLPSGVSRIFGFVALIIILFLVVSLENGYKAKSWYGPSFYPPADYRTGSIASDQGNNI